MCRAAGLVVLAMLAACGGGISAAEVREARETEHAMPLADLMAVVRSSLGDYKIDDLESVDIHLVTMERAFRDTVPALVTDSEWQGNHAGDSTYDERPNQWLRLRVDLVETPTGRYTILVRAKLRTIWKERHWDYGQAGLPGWAREEADALLVRIHRALESAR